MIDYLTCRIPVRLPCPIFGGHTAILDRQGTITKRIPHRLTVPGSYEQSLTIRAPSTEFLEIQGNPTKWLQGHNLYGPSDPLALLWATMLRLEACHTPDGPLPCSLAEMGLHGPQDLSGTIVTRIDTTEMLLLDTPGDVLSWLRSAAATGHLAHRGRGVFDQGTLVYGHARGKNFARWQIVLYSKGQEITAHRLPDFMMVDVEVLEWTNRSLRAEVRLGRLELEKLGLRCLGNWNTGVAGKIWGDKMARLDFNEIGAMSDLLPSLPLSLRPIYAAWTTGEDVRTMLSRATFYRYRRQLLELANVDIAVPPPVVPTAQVIPIKRTLEARPAGRPAWADRVDRELRAGGALVLPSAA